MYITCIILSMSCTLIDLCPCSWDSAVAMNLSEEPTESDTPSNVSTQTAQKAGQPTQTDASQGKLNGKEYAPIVIILCYIYIMLIYIVCSVESISSATGRKRSAEESTDGTQHKYVQYRSIKNYLTCARAMPCARHGHD